MTHYIRKSARPWFCMVAAVLLLTVLYGCGEGLPKNVKQNAKTVPELLKSAASAIEQQKTRFNEISGSPDFEQIRPFAEKENWTRKFDEAQGQVQNAKTIYDTELLPLVKKDKPESAVLATQLFHRIKKTLSEGHALSRYPAERFNLIRTTISNIDQAYTDAVDNEKTIGTLIRDLKKGPVDKALADFPDSAAAINGRFKPFMDIEHQTMIHLKNIELEYRHHKSSENPDYAGFTDNVTAVSALLEQTKAKTLETENEIGQLYKSYTKILKDMKVSYYVTVKRESWDENSDYYNPAFATFTREVTEEDYEALTADTVDAIAEILPGYGWSKPQSRVGPVWNRLNIDPGADWPSRHHNAASFWVEQSDEKYYHQYILENDGQTTETDWQPVSADDYENNYEYLGMAILAKPYGTFEKDRLTQAAPPGMAYVGNPEYGEWRENESGDRFWSWYGKWAFFSNLFFFPPYHYGYNSWRGWHSNYRYKKPYFGGKEKGFQRFGTYGTYVQKSPRFMSSNFAKSGGFKTQTASVKGAALRGGGPKGQGK